MYSFTGLPVPSGYSASITGVEYWDGAAPAATGTLRPARRTSRRRARRLATRAPADHDRRTASNGQATETVQVIKRTISMNVREREGPGAHPRPRVPHVLRARDRRDAVAWRARASCRQPQLRDATVDGLRGGRRDRRSDPHRVEEHGLGAYGDPRCQASNPTTLASTDHAHDDRDNRRRDRRQRRVHVVARLPFSPTERSRSRRSSGDGTAPVVQATVLFHDHWSPVDSRGASRGSIADTEAHAEVW